jgi:hypothetical protein
MVSIERGVECDILSFTLIPSTEIKRSKCLQTAACGSFHLARAPAKAIFEVHEVSGLLMGLKKKVKTQPCSELVFEIFAAQRAS